MSAKYHPTLFTPLVDILGCTYPILNAGMGGVARHELAAAVSNAGGFGCLGMVREPVNVIQREVEAYRLKCDKPFAVNLIPAATERQLLLEQIDCCIKLGVQWVELFWTVDSEVIKKLKSHNIGIIHQIGSVRDAEEALQQNVDVLIVQGVEAGGHIRSNVSTMVLLPEIVSLTPKPVIASGGIATGEGLVAAFALGAQGVSCGSLFIATPEANAHDFHKNKILESVAEDTISTFYFHRNWPVKAPVRVITHSKISDDIDDSSINDSVVIAQQDGQPVFARSTDSPLKGATGALEKMAIYAGQSITHINKIESAEAKISNLLITADRCLQKLSRWIDTITERTLQVNSPVCYTDKLNNENPEYFGNLNDEDLIRALHKLYYIKKSGALFAAKNISTVKEPYFHHKLYRIHSQEIVASQILESCLFFMGSAPLKQNFNFYQEDQHDKDASYQIEFYYKKQTIFEKELRELILVCNNKVISLSLKKILNLHECSQ